MSTSHKRIVYWSLSSFAVVLLAAIAVGSTGGLSGAPKCPPNSKLNPATGRCTCFPGMTYSKEAQSCVPKAAQCRAGQFYDNKTGRCHANCPAGQAWDPMASKCKVSKCPDTFVQQGTQCVCPKGLTNQGGKCKEPASSAKTMARAKGGQACGRLQDSRGNPVEVKCEAGLTCQPHGQVRGTCGGAPQKRVAAGEGKLCGRVKNAQTHAFDQVSCEAGSAPGQEKGPLKCVKSTNPEYAAQGLGSCKKAQAVAANVSVRVIPVRAESSSFYSVRVDVQPDMSTQVEVACGNLDSWNLWSDADRRKGKTVTRVYFGKASQCKARVVVAGKRYESATITLPR